MTARQSPLDWDLFLTPLQLIVDDDLPPGEQLRYWPPISATLITGERDAVLVDPLLTIAQARACAKWVAASGRHLTAVYVTHPHGDHFLGLGPLLEHFPDARAISAKSVIERIQQQASTDILTSYYEPRLPGQIVGQITTPEPLDGDRFALEGHDLVVIDVGHADTDGSTCLHVPEIGLVVAGDVAYSGVHLHLGEPGGDGTAEWIRALDTIEALEPIAVVAGHKRAGRPDSPTIITETREYIRDFDRVTARASTAGEIYAQMLELHPDRLNRGALWSAARAAARTA